MKEFRNTMASEAVKSKIFSVDLADEDCSSLYNWNVDLMLVDPTSPLHNDLIVLKERGGKGSIQLNITFKESYPHDPPFVLVAYPAIKGLA